MAIRVNVSGGGNPAVRVGVSGNDFTLSREAEAWAVGKRGGTDVASTDPTYHNNAKYYAETVASEAGAAQVAAIEAKGAQTIASIPNDYTALSGDVGDLKSALNNTIFFDGNGNTYAEQDFAVIKPGGFYTINICSWDTSAVTVTGGYTKFYLGYKNNGTKVRITEVLMSGTIESEYSVQIPSDVIDPVLVIGGRVSASKQGVVNIVDVSLDADVADVKRDLAQVKSAIKDVANISVSPGFEQGFWDSSPSTTRRDYVRTTSGIPVVEGDIITVDMNGYTGTEVQFNYFNADTYVSRTTVRIANFVDDSATAITPSGVDNVRINIYSGGSTIYIDPNDYASLQIFKNPITPVSKAINGFYVNVPIPFEIGLINIGTSGWAYPDENTTKRIRTIVNETIRLYNGDKIKIAQGKNIRAFVGWKSDAGNYGVNSWFTGEMDITVNGEYVITVAYNPDKDITDFGEIASSVYIERSYGAYLADLSIQKSALAMKHNNFNVARRNVKSINHRGWYTAPENTIIAFAQSKYYGFDCVETDVRVTSDGVFVLLHDTTIDRTSNGTGNIADMTYEQALQYDFGAYKAAKYAGTKIPTLQELLEFCKWTSVEPYLEIKNILTDVQIQNAVDIVNEYGMLDKVTFFGDAHVADVISQYNHDVRVGIVLFSDVTQSEIDSITSIKARGNSVFLDVQMERLTDNGVALAKNSGIPIEVWDATKEQMVTAKNYVSGYTSDNFVASLYMAQSVYKPNV